MSVNGTIESPATVERKEHSPLPSSALLAGRFLYHEQDGIRIFCADNKQLLPLLGEYDATVTDPPYGIGRKLSGNYSDKVKAMSRPMAEWDKLPGDELKLAIAKSKTSIVWGFNYLAGILGPCVAPLVWDKSIRGMHFADGEMAWTNLPNGTLRIYTLPIYKGDTNGGKEHPTQKPTGLMRWCLDKIPDAKKILDPWAGSGTTLLAARAKGIKADGIEINEQYCEAAKRRMSQGVLLAC